MKPRRLQIVAVLNGCWTGYSGGDVHFVAVLNEWSHGHDVHLIVPDGSSHELIALVSDRVHLAHVPRRIVAPSSRLTMLRMYAVRTFWAVNIIRRFPHADIVIGQSPYFFDLLPVLAGRKAKRRAIHWHHHVSSSVGRPVVLAGAVKLAEWMTAVAVRHVGITVFTTNLDTARYLEDRRVHAGQVIQTQNGRSLSQSHNDDSTAATIRVLTGSQFVLFCGRFSRLKGTTELRQLVPQLLQQDRTLRFVICGQDGPDGQALRQDLQPLSGSGRLHVLGFVRDDLRDWLLQHAHVLLAPSREEGWGITVGDALAFGSWVVAYDLPALRQAHAGAVTGLRLVPVGDVSRFAGEIVACLRSPRPNGVSANDYRAGWPSIAKRELAALWP